MPTGSNCRVVSLEQVESLGRRHARAHIPPKPSDVATLCYTSGTTGVPKGVCFYACVCGCACVFACARVSVICSPLTWPCCAIRQGPQAFPKVCFYACVCGCACVFVCARVLGPPPSPPHKSHFHDLAVQCSLRVFINSLTSSSRFGCAMLHFTNS